MHIALFTLTCSGIVWGAHSLHLSQPSSETLSYDGEVIITVPKSHQELLYSKFSSKLTRDTYLNGMIKTICGPESGLPNSFCEGDPDCEEDQYTVAKKPALKNVWDLTEKTINENVPGDFVETGVWRGGMSIFARAVQDLYNQSDSRRVYACDSYEGLPTASTDQDQDFWAAYDYMKVSLDIVAANFKRFGVLDNTVRFVKGFFNNSLPVLRKHFQDEKRSISILRGDGDMFESYYDIMYNLYEFVPVGGYFICDDCRNIHEAEHAVIEFRRRHGITEEIVPVKGTDGVSYWRKEKAVSVDYAYYLEWNSTRVPKVDEDIRAKTHADLDGWFLH